MIAPEAPVDWQSIAKALSVPAPLRDEKSAPVVARRTSVADGWRPF